MDIHPLSPVELANTATSFAHILAGMLCIALALSTRRQPKRWLIVYGSFLVTGLATIWYHGFGQTKFLLWVDWSTNVIVTHCLLSLFAYDLGSRRTFKVLFIMSAASKIITMAAMAVLSREQIGEIGLGFGEYGDFLLPEIILAVDVLLVFGIIFRARKGLSPPVRKIGVVLFLTLSGGLYFSTAGSLNLVGRIWPYHAIWHVVGAFAFLLVWIFNEQRFEVGQIIPINNSGENSPL